MYFPSHLKIPKRVRSSNWKICVECGANVAKVATRTLIVRVQRIYEDGEDLDPAKHMGTISGNCNGV
jgi:nicotinate-nucleotide pyrophosphorylase